MKQAVPTFIASEHLIWIQTDGSRIHLHAQVGVPYACDEGSWACPAALDGLDGRYPDIVGDSSMQAISLALRLIATRLGHLVETGEHLASPGEPSSRWDARSITACFGEGHVPEDPREAYSK